MCLLVCLCFCLYLDPLFFLLCLTVAFFSLCLSLYFSLLCLSFSLCLSLSFCLFPCWLSVSPFVCFSLCVSRGSISFNQDSALQGSQLRALDMLVCIPTYRHCTRLCMSICYQNFLGHCQLSLEHLGLGGSDWGARRGAWRKRTFSLELWHVQSHLCVPVCAGALESSGPGEPVGQHQSLCSAGPCCRSWGVNPVRHQGEVPGRGMGVYSGRDFPGVSSEQPVPGLGAAGGRREGFLSSMHDFVT